MKIDVKNFFNFNRKEKLKYPWYKYYDKDSRNVDVEDISIYKTAGRILRPAVFISSYFSFPFPSRALS